MKTATARYTTVKKTPHIPYPNAATKKELLNKFLDLLLTAAICAGLAALLLFLAVIV